MSHIHTNGLQLEYETFGNPQHQPVLLVMGLGMQMIGWPDPFCETLAAAGYHVVRFDNRDIGLSTHLDHLGKPNMLWNIARHKLGLPVKAPYSLADMAHDALGLLDGLGIRQAHVVGVSMGGMIAQLLTGLAPERVLSLSSIMSTSGAPGLPGPTPRARAALLSRPPRGAYQPQKRHLLVEHYLGTVRVIGSPGFPMSDEAHRARISRWLDRSIHPEGVLRQLLAVVQGPDRSPLLRQIDRPTLVVHGKEDPLVPLACGRDTAAKVPVARLVEVPGMGHDLPPGVCDILLRELTDHFSANR